MGSLAHEADAEGGCAGAAASEALQQQFSLSKEQAEGVLNMSLRRLTSLEANRLQEESQQLHARSAAHQHVPHAITLAWPRLTLKFLIQVLILNEHAAQQKLSGQTGCWKTALPREMQGAAGCT